MASYSFKSGTWDSKNQDWVIPAIPQKMVDEFDQLGGHEILWAEAMDFVADHQEFGPYAEILKAEEEDPDVEIDYEEALEISREWVKALLKASYGGGQAESNPAQTKLKRKLMR